MAPCRAAFSGRLLERLDGLEHLFDVAGHLQAAPFLHQDAVGIDQESAALDALDLLAVHDLVLDHAEHVAHLLFGVGDQLERQFQLGLEVLVRLHVVAAHAEHHGAGLDEVLVLVAELHGLGGAAGGVVLGVKIKHYLFSEETAEIHSVSILVGALERWGRHTCCGLRHDFFVFLLRLVKV